MNAEEILESCQYGASISDLTHMLEQHSKEIFALGRKAGLKEAAEIAEEMKLYSGATQKSYVNDTPWEIAEAIRQRIKD